MSCPQSNTIRHILIAVSLCLPVLGGSYVWGQWEQIHKLIAEDGEERDSFGYSVSVSGNIVVVGAAWDDGAGHDSGSAYVFDAATGEQLHKLTSDDGAESDYFGVSVSVSGNTIVVGAWWDDHSGNFSGSAYVFDALTGVQLHKLTADDAAGGEGFGRSVSVSESTIVVGAPGDNDAGSFSGSAYVFDVNTGLQLRKLTADDAAAGDQFGHRVSVSGNTIVVAAFLDDDAGNNSGSAYVFNAPTGHQLHKLTADDGVADDEFGWSVSVNGNIIVVGAPVDDDAGSSSGSAYVFNAITGEQIHKLTANDADPGDYFGHSVSVTGNIIVVGAYSDDDVYNSAGSAYVFDATAGEQLCKLTAEDAAVYDSFGRSVSVSGVTIVIGAPSNDYGIGESGSAYVFQMLDAPCPADITGDQTVDVLDLLAVLAAWGPCEPECPADITADGVVDILDLLEVLSAWGPCG